MALKLLPPGKRKNKSWIYYGRHGDEVVSLNTGCSTERAAEAWLRQESRPGGIVYVRLTAPAEHRGGFAEAAQNYARWKQIDLDDPQGAKERAAALDINRLINVLGKRQVADLRSSDLHKAAEKIFPIQQAETRNRHVIKPASAILHKAREEWKLPYIQFSKFPEKTPVTRAVALDVDDLLLRSIPEGGRGSPGSSIEIRRLVVLWFLRQGTRISETLSIAWDDIELERETFRLLVKGPRWREFALDPDVAEALRAIPEERRTGKLFPWTQKSGVYRWLRPLVRELGIEFTPHQGRHSVGKRLNDAGAGLRTIMETLGHSDSKSSLRYQAGDVEIVRAALHNLAAKRRARA